MPWKRVLAGTLATGALAVAFAGPFSQPTGERQTVAPKDAPPQPPQPVWMPMPETIDPDTGFAVHAFPPTIPDRDWHRDAWIREDCMSCHETGVQSAPIVRHLGMPALALQSKCRSCHVLIPGQTEARPPEARPPEENDNFEANAFPPMIPNTPDHVGAWGKTDCLVCHETGVGRAPKVDHDPMIPRLALIAQCRSCHVQVRSDETSPWDR